MIIKYLLQFNKPPLSIIFHCTIEGFRYYSRYLTPRRKYINAALLFLTLFIGPFETLTNKEWLNAQTIAI